MIMGECSQLSKPDEGPLIELHWIWRKITLEALQDAGMVRFAYDFGRPIGMPYNRKHINLVVTILRRFATYNGILLPFVRREIEELESQGIAECSIFNMVT